MNAARFAACLALLSAPALAQEGGQGWSVLSGQALGTGANVFQAQAGYPGLSVGYLYGLNPNIDLGASFTLNYGLEGDVQASVVGNSLHSESASASADPFIFVDPAFSNASLYSIVVSPGVGNAGALAVPEPGGIWPMLAVGLAAIGFTRVRRRRSAD